MSSYKLTRSVVVSAGGDGLERKRCGTAGLETMASPQVSVILLYTRHGCYKYHFKSTQELIKPIKNYEIIFALILVKNCLVFYCFERQFTLLKKLYVLT